MVLIGDVSYTTIKEAINAGNIECTLKLEGAMTEDVFIPENRVVNIDLNNFPLTNNELDTITVKGSVRVYDSSKQNGGTLGNKTAGKSVMVILKGGNAEVDVKVGMSGHTDAPVINNVAGNLTLSKHADINSDNTAQPILENGLEAGEDFATTAVLGGAYTIAGGKFAMNNEMGVLNVFGGDVDSSTDAIVNQGILNVKGGILTASNVAIATKANGTGIGVTNVLGGKLEGGKKDLSVAEADSKHAVVKVSGGNFSKTVPPEYLAPGAVVVAGVGEELGTFNVVFPMDAIKGDLGMVGGGFVAKARMVLHYDTLTYKTGGITLPVLPMAVDAVVVNVKDGAMAYFDRTEKKVVLYSANKTEIVGETVLEDLNLIIIGQ